jgi:hypothetical protein
MLLRAAFGIASLSTFVSLHAQDTGRIIGTVFDPARAVIPNVRVSLAGPTETQTQISDGMGRVSFTNLPPGTYRLEATSPGFKKSTNTGLKVLAANATSVEIVLNIDVPVCDPGPKTVLQPISSNASEVSGRVTTYPLLPPKVVAQVFLKNARTGKLVASTVANSKGEFDLKDIPPGAYILTAHRDGWGDFIMESLKTQRGYATVIKWDLELPACSPGKPCRATKAFPPLLCL